LFKSINDNLLFNKLKADPSSGDILVVNNSANALPEREFKSNSNALSIFPFKAKSVFSFPLNIFAIGGYLRVNPYL
jgi:hypothetical protein